MATSRAKPAAEPSTTEPGVEPAPARPRAKKAAEPGPHGLGKAQVTRFMKLLAVPGEAYEAW